MRQSVLMEQFGKGLDLVSSVNNIEQGFTPNAKNFRIAEYGGIEKILGYETFATLGGDAHELSSYRQRDGNPNVLVAALSTSWETIADDATVTAIRNGMNATTNTTFVTHEEILYGLDPLNNIGVWDGAALNTYAPGVNTGPPKGIILGIWQNRMWVAKANASGDITLRVDFSEPPGVNGFVNNVDQWPTANYVELGGTGQTERIVGGVATGNGLVVFTTGSTFLIYDDDGSNRVVDGARGCSSRKSIAQVGSDIYGVNELGIFRTDGSFPLEVVSSRVDPLFLNESPDVTGAAGVHYRNSYLMSYQRVEAYNDLTLDVSNEGAVMANDYPSACWTVSDLEGQYELYFLDASDPASIRKAFTGGAFNGNQIDCHYEMPFDPFGNEHILKRLHRIRVVGRGDITASVIVDYYDANEASGTLGFPGIDPTSVWGTMLWGSGTWSGYSLYEGWCQLPCRGRRFSIRFAESGSTTYTDRDPLDVSSGGELGGAGVYLCEAHFSTSTRTR